MTNKGHTYRHQAGGQPIWADKRTIGRSTRPTNASWCRASLVGHATILPVGRSRHAAFQTSARIVGQLDVTTSRRPCAVPSPLHAMKSVISPTCSAPPSVQHVTRGQARHQACSMPPGMQHTTNMRHATNTNTPPGVGLGTFTVRHMSVPDWPHDVGGSIADVHEYPERKDIPDQPTNL